MKMYWLCFPFFLLSGVSIADTQIGTWNMTINGTVLPSSCDIDDSSQTQSINLGTFSANTFSSMGDVSPDVPLDIKLTGCGDSIVGATLTFSGNADSGNSNLLALSDTTGTGMLASGVGVEIKDSDGTIIPLNTASKQYPLSAGDNTLNFLLHYKATAIPVTAGYATAVMYFDVDYQ
ncbi:TPA: fimbrial protein [Klebsiella michiganensis]